VEESVYGFGNSHDWVGGGWIGGRIGVGKAKSELE